MQLLFIHFYTNSVLIKYNIKQKLVFNSNYYINKTMLYYSTHL